MTAGRRRVVWALVALSFVALLAAGARRTPTEGVSSDRLYALADDLRCLQCAGESVANSGAPIALTMRSEIESQMSRGRTDAEIMAFFRERYGPRVLLNPPSDGVAGLIWVIPVVVTAAGAAGLALAFGRWRRERDRSGSVEATDEDRRLVEEAR